MSKTQKIFTTAIAVFLILALVVSGFLFWKHHNLPKVVTYPIFSFDQSKAPDWWSGGNSSPELSETEESQRIDQDPLPAASITAFQGTMQTPGACFIMAFYNDNKTDLAQLLKDRESGMIVGQSDPSVLKQIDSTRHSIETFQGTKDYTLSRYDLDLAQVQRGNAFGFIEMSDGYIEIRAVCKTAEDLETIAPGLAALSLRQ